MRRLALLLLMLPALALAEDKSVMTGEQYLQERLRQAETAAVAALNEVKRLEAVVKERDATIKDLQEKAK